MAKITRTHDEIGDTYLYIQTDAGRLPMGMHGRTYLGEIYWIGFHPGYKNLGENLPLSVLHPDCTWKPMPESFVPDTKTAEAKLIEHYEAWIDWYIRAIIAL